MAQLGNTLRFTLRQARVEKAGGLLSWGRSRRDERVHVRWTAETRRREGTEQVPFQVAEGEMTGDELRWWAGWFVWELLPA